MHPAPPQLRRFASRPRLRWRALPGGLGAVPLASRSQLGALLGRLRLVAASLGWWLVGWLLLAWMPACAAPLASTDLDREAREANSVERAAAVLDEAERALDLAIAHDGESKLDDDRARATAQAAVDGQPVPAQPATEPSAGHSPAGTAATTERSNRRTGALASRCSRACRAFGSMQRAADRLCALTGPDDGRCGAAHRRVQAAQRLVRRVCPGCQPR